MTDDQASDVAERLRKMIAETNRNCLLSSWLTFLDTASEVLQELTAARARLAEVEELDRWACGMQAVLSDLSHLVNTQTENLSRPVRPIVLGATLCQRIIDAVKLPQTLGGESDDPATATIAGRTIHSLRSALEMAAPHLCGAMCPSVKYDNEPWKHCDECKAVTAALSGLQIQIPSRERDGGA